jgi:DNA-binding transcriptional ArsR family regulator
MAVNMFVDDDRKLTFAKVLADATRQRLMALCCCEWRSVGELVESLGGDVSQPTVSHHLAVLRRAGLVDVRREGRNVLYTLDQEQVAGCCGRLVAEFAPESEAAAMLRRPRESGGEGTGV